MLKIFNSCSYILVKTKICINRKCVSHIQLSLPLQRTGICASKILRYTDCMTTVGNYESSTNFSIDDIQINRSLVQMHPLVLR